MIIALIGCHGAGKTTLGAALAARLGWASHDEIGRRLAEDHAHRPAAVTAHDPQEAFDDAVIREELARDEAWDPREHRLVETWHPGNLAYAAARSPLVVDRYHPRIIASVKRQPTLMIEVTASREVLARRKTEAGQLSFFLDVGAASVRWAAALGLAPLARAVTDAEPPESLADEIATRVRHALVRGGM